MPSFNNQRSLMFTICTLLLVCSLAVKAHKPLFDLTKFSLFNTSNTVTVNSTMLRQAYNKLGALALTGELIADEPSAELSAEPSAEPRAEPSSDISECFSQSECSGLEEPSFCALFEGNLFESECIACDDLGPDDCFAPELTEEGI